jgi:hypothetical protein
MAAGKRRHQVGALMISSVVALGVSVISSSANAEDDASRFTYVRLHCTADNQSHFTDVTIELTKENFAPPAAPIAIGGNKPTSRAFIARFEAHWGAADVQTHLNHPTPAVQLFTVLRGVFSITVTDGETRRYMPVTWSCWKTSHLAEVTLLSWATNPDFYSSLADFAKPCKIRINILARLLHLLRCT